MYNVSKKFPKKDINLNKVETLIKLRYSKKATKFWKKSPNSFDITKTIEIFFQNSIAFSKYL